MPTVSEEIRLNLEKETNRARMELLSTQAKYYHTIIQGIFFKYLSVNEPIEIYTKDELQSMLQEVQRVIEELETESYLDGSMKYDLLESKVFINECIQRMMDKYGFYDWIIE